MAENWGENDPVVSSDKSAGGSWGENDEVVQDNPLARGFKKAGQSAGIVASLAAQDNAAVARKVSEAADYAKANPGSKEGAELMDAWNKGDGISGGISGVAGEVAKDWREAKGFIPSIKSVAKNVQAMGSGIVEQTPNMIAPMAGMVAGGLAGSFASPVVGTAAGGWAGAAAGNTLMEGGGMVQEALQRDGINPNDQAAVKAYLDVNGNKLLGQAGVKGSIIGAVDTLTAGLGHFLLTGPGKAAANRALTDLGVDMANKAAVKTAMNTPEFAAKVGSDAAFQASQKGAQKLARNAGAAALDPAGEFAGEYLGQGVATDDWDTKNAALEALSSVGQSGIMFAGQKVIQSLQRPKSDAAGQTAPPSAPPEQRGPIASLGFNPDAVNQSALNRQAILDQEEADQGAAPVSPENIAAAYRANPQATPEQALAASQALASEQADNEIAQGSALVARHTLPSEKMGLAPTAGPSLTNAAILAVDTGAGQPLTEAESFNSIPIDEASDEDRRAYEAAFDRPAPPEYMALSPSDRNAILFSNKEVDDGGKQFPGTQDGDILNGAGDAGVPFKTPFAAIRRARLMGKNWTIAQVEDGFVARWKDPAGTAIAQDAPAAVKAAKAQPPANNNAQTTTSAPAAPAAGLPAEGAGAVEAAGLSDKLEDALFKERDATNSAIENDWMNGNGRRRQTNIERAIQDAVNASTLDADNAAQIVETALENERFDLAQYAASRAMRAAKSMNTTPGVSQSSPKYGEIKSDLEARKKQAIDAASALQEIVNSKQAPQAVGAQPASPAAGVPAAGTPAVQTDGVKKGDWIKLNDGADQRPRQVDDVGPDGWVYTKAGDSLKPGQFTATDAPVAKNLGGFEKSSSKPDDPVASFVAGHMGLFIHKRGAGLASSVMRNDAPEAKKAEFEALKAAQATQKQGSTTDAATPANPGAQTSPAPSAQGKTPAAQTGSLTLPKGDYKPSQTFELDGRKWVIGSVAHTGNELVAGTNDGGAFRRETIRLVDGAAQVAPSIGDKPSPVGTVAPGGEIRSYNLVSINEKTGEKTTLTKEPVSHKEAVTIKSKFADKPGRRIQLEDVTPAAGQSPFVPPLVTGMIQAATGSASSVKDRITNVRYAPSDGATNSILFDLDGKPMSAVLRGRNADAALMGNNAESDKGWAARALLDGDAQESKPPKKQNALQKRVQKAQQDRADYFTPGNIVKSYDGHDRVISYTPPAADGSGWSVRVRSVVQKDGQWINDPKDNRERTHTTQPDAKALAAGPVFKPEGTSSEPQTNQAQQAEAQRPQEQPAAAGSVDSIAKAINLQVETNRRNAQRKYREERIAKKQVPNTTEASENSAFEAAIAAGPLKGQIEMAEQILAKDPVPLIHKFVYGDFEASEMVFAKVTGVKIKGLSMAAKKAALYKWAGWTDAQIATAEKAAEDREAARQAGFKQKDLEYAVTGAWHELDTIKVKMQTGEELSGQSALLKMVKDGFDEVTTFKKGVATVYGLKNATNTISMKDAKWNNFLKAARAFGGLKQALELVKANTVESKPDTVFEVGSNKPAEPFVHSGLKIRTERVKVGDEVQSRWVVQTPENAEREAKGERQIGGDRIVSTREAAISVAEEEIARSAKEKARVAEAKQADDAAQAKKDANKGKSILQRRTDSLLDKKHTYPPQAGLGAGTRREAMQKAVDQGRAIVERMVPDTAAKHRDQTAIDLVRARGYILGFSNENIPVVKQGLEAQARLKLNQYEKPEYRVYDSSKTDGGFYAITKTEFDYAKSLAEKAKDPHENYIKSASDSIARLRKSDVYRVLNSLSKDNIDGVTLDGLAGYIKKNHPDYAQEVDDVLDELLQPTPAAPVHQDPGEKPESATAPVIAESLQKAAKKEERPLAEMKAELLGMIDAAIKETPNYQDYLDAVEKFGKEAADGMYTNPARPMGADTPDGKGRITFDVPGDGKFVVTNSFTGLTAFRAKINKASGNGFSATKRPGLPASTSVKKGSANQISAIESMLEDGDLQAAKDYMAAVGIGTDGLKKSALARMEQLEALGDKALETLYTRIDPEWQYSVDRGARNAFLSRTIGKDVYRANVIGGTNNDAPADFQRATYSISKNGEKAKPGSAGSFHDALVAVQDSLDKLTGKTDAVDAVTESTASDTGWSMAGTGYAGKRYSGRNMTLEDGREVVARIYENAGVYEEAEVKVDGKRVFAMTDRVDAQGKADDFIRTLTAGTEKLDLMGFTKTPTGNGGFTLTDSNMRVTVEPTGTGLRASFGSSAASGPRLNEQQAIEWAANLRDDSIRIQKDEAKAKPTNTAKEPWQMTEAEFGEVERQKHLANIKYELERAKNGSLKPFVSGDKSKLALVRRLTAEVAQIESAKPEGYAGDHLSQINKALREGKPVPEVNLNRYDIAAPTEGRLVEVSAPSLAKRTNPTQTIEFKNPIVGPSGEKLVSYTWQWKPFEYVDKTGEERTGKLSDWDKSAGNVDTGREVVHQFTVENKDGETRIVSAESAIAALGYADKVSDGPAKSAISAAKTLARNKMQLAEIESALSAFMADQAEVNKLALPEIVQGIDGWWSMGDSMVRQTSQLFKNSRPGELLPERMKVLEDGWRSNRLADRGWSISTENTLKEGIYDTNARIKRAQAKLDAMAAQEPGPTTGHTIGPVAKTLVESEQNTAAKAEPANTGNGLAYPLAPAGTRYEETSAQITMMTPDAYLAAVRPLDIDEASRDNIDDLKAHILSGKTLDPLHIRADGKEDGRHRAVAAKELGIAQVPVVDERTSTDKAGTTKIDDFGEKLPPARRTIARQLSEDLSNDDIVRLPLSQVWPASEIDAIDDSFVAAAATVMREAVPSKPRIAYKVKAWAEKVQLLRSTTAMLVSGKITREQFTEKMGEGRFYALRNLLSKIKLLEKIDRSQWGRIGEVQEWPDAVKYDNDGKQVSVPQAMVTIDDKRHNLKASGDLSDHIDAITALLAGDAKEKRIAFEIRGSGNSFFINKTGDKQYRHLMEFTSANDARDALNNRYKDVVAAWEAIKDQDNITERDLRSMENRPRTGKDWRNGKDVTAEEFQEKFGFKGGEFGKWVSQGKGAQERQFFLNNSYDALMDLADIVGIPPRAISLEGSLGIAFGSRGAGWASAHFEPSNLVINLTKPRGAGSLAHEWFHALDNYFARKRGGEVPMNGSQSEYRNNNYITHRTRPMMVRKDGRGTPITRERLAEWRKSSKGSSYLSEDQWIEDPKHKQGVRAEVEERFDGLVKALNESPMTNRARVLDGVKENGSGYWSSTLERAARSFENYVQSRMLEQGYHNDFLANVKDAVETGKNLGRYPYLMPSEIAPVADAFSSLFDTIETKDTDSGVAMFSRAEPPTKSELQQVLDTHKELTDAQSINDIDGLRAGVSAKLGASIPAKAFMAVRLPQADALNRIARAFGKRVVGFAVGLRHADIAVFDGATGFKNSDVIYLRAGSARPHMALLGHELLHNLKAENPALYGELLSELKGNAPGFGEFAKNYPGMDQQGILEEFVADIVADGFMSDTFWNAFGQANPSLLARFASALKSIIDKVRRVMVFSPETRAYLKDYDAAMAAAGRAMAKYQSTPAFSRPQQTFSPRAQAQATEAVERLANGIAARWANGPKIVVAFDMNDPRIPERVRQEDLKQRSGGAGTPEGFFYKGTAYLLSSKLPTPQDTARVLFHEALGHYGLRGLFGDALTPILQQISVMRRAQVDSKITEYRLRGVENLDRLTAAEEVLAEMAQNTPEIGFVKRAIAAVRTWLRQNVPGFKNLELTDAEIIANYILPARDFVERGQKSKAGGLPMFSRDTKQLVTNPNDVVGNQGGRFADDSTPGVVYKDNMPPERKGFTRLYHGGSGNEGVKDFDRVPSGGTFDGFFAHTGRNSSWGAHGSGHDYFMDVDDGKILSDYELNYHTPYEEVLPAFEKVTGIKEGDEHFESVWKAVIEDNAQAVEDEISEAFGAYDPGEAMWMAQKYRGQVAKLLGFDAIQMEDEHGTGTVLVVSGVKVTRAYDPNESTAPTSDGAPMFIRGTKQSVTNPNDVVGNQGGRSADDSTPGADKYQMAGPVVDGRDVRDDVPNMSSIASSLDDYTVLKGVREVPMSDFTFTGKSYSVSETKRIENLAERIKESGEINPLIVVVDKEGSYVLEGGHRGEALFRLGAKSFPAVVVLDNESLNESTAPTSDGAPMFSRGDQTSTPAFKAWFGDSKVVDADGKPLVVYHGTPKVGFTAFDTSNVGTFFSDRFDVAASFAGRYNEVEFDEEGAYADSMQGVYDAYLSLQNPMVLDWAGKDWGDGPDGLRLDDWANRAKRAGNDGLVVKNVVDSGWLSPGLVDGKGDGGVYIAFNPEQIKSATGNNGDFDPDNDDIRFSRSAAISDITRKATDAVATFTDTPGKLNWWHKSVGTQYNLSRRSPSFKRVFDAVQDFISDVSYYATEAADMAPSLLPKLETWRDIVKSPVSGKDMEAIRAPIWEGTLIWARDESGKPVKLEKLKADAKLMTADQKSQRLLRNDKISEGVLKMWRGLPIDQYEAMIDGKYEKEMLKGGVLWSDAELRSMFGLADGQIKLYKEFRKATDKSLTNLAISDMLFLAGKDADPIRDAVLKAKDVDEAALTLRDYLMSLTELDPDSSDRLLKTANMMVEKADRANDLMDRGYAPLSRFGAYTLDVVDANGERVYFGMFESRLGAAKMSRQMAEAYPGARITQGTQSQEAYKLFAGVSPETVELFGDMMGLEDNAAYQQYLKMAKSTRSAMKRLIERKGIAGFSEDAGRVLAGFVYSNARQTSQNLHTGEMGEAANAIPQQQGELKDHAVKLVDYIKNPQEEAQQIRGLLFAQYIGGSVASAMVNMTQPLTMTIPWLSQFGGIQKASRQMGNAIRDMSKKSTGDAKLDAALKKAEEDGTVSPQEVHDLMRQSQGKGALQAGDGTLAGEAKARGQNALSRIGFAWGKLFSAAEQFNRRSTYIAAYRTAVEQGMTDPDGFARRAIHETQGVYNKGNKPKWARGAVGGTIFTFKQYGISYIEMLGRMASAGEPGSAERAAGRRSALYALAILMMLSGAGGLPGADDLDDLISGLMQSMGYNFDSKARRKAFLAEYLGEGAAEFLDRGVSGIAGVPIDVSGRLGLGNMIPATGLFTNKRDHTRDVLEIAGPAGDLFKRGFDAAGKAIKGDVFGLRGAVATIAPKAVQNTFQSADMMDKGMYRDQSGKKVIETDAMDALFKAIGFQPNVVKDIQDRTSEQFRASELNKLRESAIADKWARGVFEKDNDLIQRARDDLAQWNADNPESPIRINFQQIRQRVQAMNMSKSERIIKAAPKELRQQARESLAVR